jgi:hypothetical protein
MSEPCSPPSSLPAHLRPITVSIPGLWTPEQALAVFELLDELREKIWIRYGSEIQLLLQEMQAPAGCHHDHGSADDPSF